MLSHPDADIREASREATDPIPNAAHNVLVGMRCLVLGAGGFLGNALCAALRNHGAVVHAYGRSLSAPSPNGGVLWTEAAFEDAPALATAL